ncbi:MAG: hypothetical protein A2017_06000 [Lentisphaerae bacterium GWF2_44_16]|nr:MAG: hypothetical protein A2017_06000 [Lentisphaerae bacterium GWF2_44_16]
MFLKWNKLVIFGLLAFLSSSRIMADEFEPGGVSFDFQKISDQRFKNKPKNIGENLVTNADFSMEKSEHLYGNWAGHTGVHLRDTVLGAKLRETIEGLVIYKIVDLPEGGRAAYIKKPLELENICAENTVSVSGKWAQLIKMPDTTGGCYSVNFKYKGAVFGKFYTSCYLIVTFRDNSGKTPTRGIGTGKPKIIKYSRPKQDWQTFTADFEIPVNTSWLELILRIDGTGEIYFSDVQLQKNIQDMPLSICLAPMSFMDNTFCLSQNDPAIMVFAWRRNLPKDKIELKQPVLYVELPESVQVKAARDGLKLISSEPKTVGGKAYKLHKIDLSSVRERPLQIEDYDTYLVHSLLVFTSDAPSTVLPNGFCWVSDGGKQLTNKESFQLKVIPQIKLSAKSDIFMNGFFTNGSYMNFSGTENKELLGRFIGNMGTAWIVLGKCDPEMMGVYRRNGIKIITPQLFLVANGYRIGPKNKPEYAQFKPLGKSKNANLINGTCPVAIYTESEYFKKSVLPYLESNLKGFDGLWANWEPYMFNGMGCFCDNCRDEFIKYSKLPPEEVKATWPNEMTIGKKYYDICTRFRSYQHALLVKTIDRAVNSVTTGKAGFIPGVAWCIMTDSKNGRAFCKEHDPLDYASSFKYINPWGPYSFWLSQKPYSYTKGFNLYTFVVAQKVREFTDKNFIGSDKPKLQALPHGIQGDFWVTQPESITMDIISFFLNRFDASTTYTFPRGYDNRYWAAQAEASRLIAEYEKYVFKGNCFDGFASLPVTPYPAPVKKVQQKFFPEMHPVDMLQATGFKLDGKYLAAVGNFWEKGDVFFKLSVKGLDKDIRYVLVQPDKKRYFAGEKSAYFTGDELEKGVLLHAGALRWVFFVIKPFKEKTDYGRKITLSDVTAAMERHLPEITKAADIEKKNDAAEEAENQKSELKPLSNGKLSCTPVNGNEGEQQLKFTSGDNELLLGLNGMCIKSWKINKNEFVFSDNGKLGLGLPAFWQPPAMIMAPYHVKKFETVGTGIMIVAERPVTVKESAPLEYITVRQKIGINSDCSAVRIETELLNTSSDETGPRDITVGFRYHNIPLWIGDGGSVVMKNNGKEFVFKRKFERILFAMPQAAASAEKIKKLFEVGNPEIGITEPEAVFVSKDNKTAVKMKLTPASAFAGFAVWDTPTLKSPTFEAFFTPVTIKSQQSAKFSMSLMQEN